jgi:hypothetical protein
MKFIPEIPIATKALLLHHLHKNNAIELCKPFLEIYHIIGNASRNALL